MHIILIIVKLHKLYYLMPFCLLLFDMSFLSISSILFNQCTSLPLNHYTVILLSHTHYLNSHVCSFSVRLVPVEDS